MRGKILILFGCFACLTATSSSAKASEDALGKPPRPALTALLVEELESWEDRLEKERSRALETLPSLTGGLKLLRPPAES